MRYETVNGIRIEKQERRKTTRDFLKRDSEEYNELKANYNKWLAEYEAKNPKPWTDEQEIEAIKHDPEILTFARWVGELPQ